MHAKHRLTTHKRIEINIKYMGENVLVGIGRYLDRLPIITVSVDETRWIALGWVRQQFTDDTE